MEESGVTEMSKFYFENQGNGTYLVYPVGSDEQVDALTLGMLTNNSIKNFAPVVYTQQDQEKYIKYNVTTRISVQQMLMSPVNKKQLLGLLTGIAAAVSDAEEYMIDVRSILFDTNYIFADTAGETTVMICLPVIEEQTQLPDMKLFFKELLFSVSLNPEENNDYFVQMINYLNKETSFSIEAFSEFLKKLSVEATPMIQGNVQTPARQENMQPQASQVQTQPQTSQGQAQPRQNQPQAAPGNTYRPQPQVPQSGQPVMQAQKPQAQNQPDKIERTISMALRYSLYMGILCVGLFTRFGPALGETFYHNADAGRFIQILSWLCPFLYLSTTMGSILNGLGKTGTVFIHHTVSMLLTLSLVLFAIPRWGIFAYLAALLISELVLAFLHIHALACEVPIRLPVSQGIVKPAFCLLVSIGMLEVIPNASYLPHLFPPVLIQSGILCLLYIGGLLLLHTGTVKQ